MGSGNDKHRSGFTKIPRRLLDERHSKNTRRANWAEFCIYILRNTCWDNRIEQYPDPRGHSHEIHLRAGHVYLNLRMAERELRRFGLTHKKLRTLEKKLRGSGQLIRVYRPGKHAGWVYDVCLGEEPKKGTVKTGAVDSELPEINGDTSSKWAQCEFQKGTHLIDGNLNSTTKRAMVYTRREGVSIDVEREKASKEKNGAKFWKIGAKFLGQNIERHRMEFERLKPSLSTMPEIGLEHYLYVCGYIVVNCESNFVEKMISEDSFGALNLISEFDSWRQGKLAQGENILPYNGPRLIIGWAKKSRKLQNQTNDRQLEEEKSHEHC